MADQSDFETGSTAAAQPLLTRVEARILGALMEKQRTTPDYYPMTLNALVQACNQKTSRDPVMQLTPGEAGHTVNQLRDRGLVRASFHGRAERYEQRLTNHLELDLQEAAAVCVLLLRGPQTLGEIRTNSARLAEFPDLGAVTDTLELLMAREPALVQRLPRARGRREERFAQLLCGEPDPSDLDAGPRPRARLAGSEELSGLRQEIQQMRAELDSLWQLTGLAEQRPVSEPDQD
jgi:uncharacterized protein YceH (UPF0502 family)